MNFRSYLIVMTLGTAAAWIAWAVVLHGIDPSRSGLLGFLLFYVTLAMSVFGSIALLGMLVRLWHSEPGMPSRIAMRSFRQGLLLTGVGIASLLLFSQGLFRWWAMLLIVIIATFIELAFLSARRS